MLTSNAECVVKAGFNKWQELVRLPMTKAPELADVAGSDWWSVDITLPEVPLQSYRSPYPVPGPDFGSWFFPEPLQIPDYPVS